MKKIVMLLVIGAVLMGAAAPAFAGPADKIIRWVKDPCVPNGGLEDDCLQ